MHRITLYDFIWDEIKGGRIEDLYLSDSSDDQRVEDLKNPMNKNQSKSTNVTNEEQEEKKYDFYNFIDNFFKTNSIPTNALEHMINVPYFLEKIMSFSFLLCLDNLLYDITFMPIQVIRSAVILIFIFFKSILFKIYKAFAKLKQYNFFKYTSGFSINFRKYNIWTIRNGRRMSSCMKSELAKEGIGVHHLRGVQRFPSLNPLDNDEYIYACLQKGDNGSSICNEFIKVRVNPSRVIDFQESKMSSSSSYVLDQLKSKKFEKEMFSSTSSTSKFMNEDNFTEVENSKKKTQEWKRTKSSDHKCSPPGKKKKDKMKLKKKQKKWSHRKLSKDIENVKKSKRLFCYFGFMKEKLQNLLKLPKEYVMGFFKKFILKIIYFIHINKLYELRLFKSEKKISHTNALSFETSLFKKTTEIKGSNKLNILKRKGKDSSNFSMYDSYNVMKNNIIISSESEQMECGKRKDDDSNKIRHHSVPLNSCNNRINEKNNLSSNDNNRKNKYINNHSSDNDTNEMNTNMTNQFQGTSNKQCLNHFLHVEDKEFASVCSFESFMKHSSEINIIENKEIEKIIDANMIHGENEELQGKEEDIFVTSKSMSSGRTRVEPQKEIRKKKESEDPWNFSENENDPSEKKIPNEESIKSSVYITSMKKDKEIKEEKKDEDDKTNQDYKYKKRNIKASDEDKAKKKKNEHRKLLKQHVNSLKLSFPEYSGMIRISLIIICIYFFSFMDTSRIYHYIRAQPFMKLYVILNMLEILERLLRSIGKDLIDNMTRTFTRIINLHSYIYIMRKSYYDEKRNSNPSFHNASQESSSSDGSMYNGIKLPKNKNPTFMDNNLSKYSEEPNVKKEWMNVKSGGISSNIIMGEKNISFMNKTDGTAVEEKTESFVNKETNEQKEFENEVQLSIFFPFYSIVIKFILQYFLVLFYILIHSFIHLVRFLSLNIAINSSESKMFLILVMSNFTEIKSTVFKKFTNVTLFTIVASDAVERFYLFIDALLVLLKMSTAYRTQNSFLSISSWLIIILLLEVGVDWCKHAYLLKFNGLKSESLNKYFLTLMADVLIARTPSKNIHFMKNSFTVPCKNIFCFSHIPTRRLGYMSMPAVTLIVSTLPRLNYLSNLSLFSFAISIWICLFLFKIILSIIIVSYSISERHNLKNLDKPFDAINAL